MTLASSKTIILDEIKKGENKSTELHTVSELSIFYFFLKIFCLPVISTLQDAQAKGVEL